MAEGQAMTFDPGDRYWPWWVYHFMQENIGRIGDIAAGSSRPVLSHSNEITNATINSEWCPVPKVVQ